MTAVAVQNRQLAPTARAKHSRMKRSLMGQYDRLQLAPLIGSVGFTVAAGAIAVGTVRAFVDRIGQAAASGITQTRANCTHGGGQSNSGELWYLHGFGIHVHNTARFLDAPETQHLIWQTALLLRIGNQTQELGRVGLWPAGVGVNGQLQNGEPAFNKLARFSQGPIIVDPQTVFELEFALVNALTVTTAQNTDVIEMTAFFLRTVDYDVDKRAGA